MTSRARTTFAAFLFLLAVLPLSSSPGQVPAPPGPPLRLHSALVTSTLRTLCVITNSCPLPKPLITSVMPFSTITPGGGVIVQGENFADAKGRFGEFQLIPCSGETYKLENLQWGDTFAAGTIPTNVSGQVDTCGILSIVRSDGAVSNPINVAFIATRDFAVLPPTDVAASCSDGADSSNMCEYDSDASVSGHHNSIWGHDMGMDRFTAKLQNGWVFYDMDFTVVTKESGGVQPPAGFTPFSNSVQLNVYWDQEAGSLIVSHGADTSYLVNLYIMGPKGVAWNR